MIAFHLAVMQRCAVVVSGHHNYVCQPAIFTALTALVACISVCSLVTLPSLPLSPSEFPRFTNKVDPGPTSSNSRVLSVLVTGDPTPDVEWLHNDEATDVSSNSRLSISSVAEGEGQKEMLTITDIQPEDRGTYTLRANNIAGRAEEDWLVPVACK